MDITRQFLPTLHLLNIFYQLVIGLSTRTISWFEDETGANNLYRPQLLTTTEASPLTCLAVCSITVTCKAATYNNVTGECICLHSKTIITSQPGNRLWHRQFDGFIYNAQLGWYIRVVGNMSLTQPDAEAFCGTLGARLAVLDTDGKINYATALPDYYTYIPFYVGAMYNQTEGAFLWSTGAKVSTNWRAGEPNGFFRDEKCVALYWRQLVDIPCNSIILFICEIM